MSTWTMPAYMTALRDNLRARPGMENVTVASAPISPDDWENAGPDGAIEIFVFIDVRSEEASAALGDRRREEEYVIEGVCEVNYPGMGEDSAVTARDRCAALIAELESEIRSTPDAGLGPSVVRFSEITELNLRQRIREGYRRAIIEFDITVKTRKAP